MEFTIFHLIAAGVVIAVLGGWLVRRIEHYVLHVSLPKSPVDDYLIHQTLRHPQVRSFSERAAKGAKASLMQPTRDDRLMADLETRRRLSAVVDLSERRKSM